MAPLRVRILVSQVFSHNNDAGDPGAGASANRSDVHGSSLASLISRVLTVPCISTTATVKSHNCNIMASGFLSHRV
jgi:hypothetical protein